MVTEIGYKEETLKSCRYLPYVTLFILSIAPFYPGNLLGQELLRGQVVIGDIPVTDGFVMLHSVSSLRAGQVDSVALDHTGTFEFALEGFGEIQGMGEVYFGSVEYQNVLYFGGPITEREQLETIYSIPVFAAKSVSKEGVSLPIIVRNLLLEKGPETWQVRDVIAIENPGDQTLVPTEGGVVWSYPLPEGFENPEIVRGELPPEDVTFTDGRVLVKAPLPPGERMLVIVYQLPELEMAFPAPGATRTFELFVKEPAPTLEVTSLNPLDVVSLEPGSSYRRYSGSNLRDVTLSVTEVPDRKPYPLGRLSFAVGIILSSMIGILGLRMSSNANSRKPPTAKDKRSIILEIAQLDELLESDLEEKKAADARARRTELVALLKDQG